MEGIKLVRMELRFVRSDITIPLRVTNKFNTVISWHQLSRMHTSQDGVWVSENGMQEEHERSMYIQAKQNMSIFIPVDGKTTAEPCNNAE